jgi:hypothetical protein
LSRSGKSDSYSSVIESTEFDSVIEESNQFITNMGLENSLPASFMNGVLAYSGNALNEVGLHHDQMNKSLYSFI